MVALQRYRVIRPFLERDSSQAEVARAEGIDARTVRCWIERYRKFGLAGLARKVRRDKDTRKLPTSLYQVIEGLALKKPRLSVATVHRHAILPLPPSREAAAGCSRCDRRRGAVSWRMALARYVYA